MGYMALYRKFRPATFDEVKGQDHIVKTLQNQIRADRIGHAYLFCGTRGTGKTTVAKILARAVNCEHPTENGPCNQCPTCQAILKGTSTNVIEIDAASNNGVDNIREIREEVTYRPTQGRYKVYIIDEVHMLSAGAFNALLKTLEEPPEYVIFILATTEVNKIPVTILSRCQRYNFHRISIRTIADRLTDLLQREGIEAEERAVRYVARAGDGSMRDALSLMEQCIAFYMGETLTYDRVLQVLGTVDTEVFSQLLREVIAGNAAGSIRILESIIQQGKEISQFVSDFTWYLRNLLLVQSAEVPEDVLDVSSENLQQLREESGMLQSESLMRYIRIFSELSGQIRFSAQKRVLVETALIRLCRPQMDTDLSGVLERIRQLEKKLEKGVYVRAEGSSAAAGEKAVAGSPEERKPKTLPKAVPEDLKQIVSQWGSVRARAGGALRSYLSMTVPKYDGRTGETRLYLEAENDIVAEGLRQEDNLEELKKIFLDIMHKEIAVQIVCREEKDLEHLEEIPLEEQLKAEINMPITEEDDPDEDEEF